MASIERTAYPRFGKRMSAEELRARYELSDAEHDFVSATANGGRQRLTLAALLKIRQQLGYFPDLKEVPGQIVQYLTGQLGFADRTQLLNETHLRTTLHRYRTAVRDFLGSKAYGPDARQALEQMIRKAAETMSDPADLINVAVAELSKAGIELPAYSTLDRLVGTLRQQVHAELYVRATRGLTAEQKDQLDTLLAITPGGQVTGFNLLKNTPGPAKLKYIREWAAHLQQLERIIDPRPFLTDIPHTKIRQFAAEASALEISDIRNMRHRERQYTLLLCLLRYAQSRTRDELVEMFLRRMHKTENAAREKLALLREEHREVEEALLQTFGKVLEEAKQAGQSDAAFGQTVRATLAGAGGAEALREQYEAVAAYHQNNFRPLLWPAHIGYRVVLFELLDLLAIGSASQDAALMEALAFVKTHRHSRKETLPYEIDLGFAGPRWQTFIETEKKGEILLNRRALEVCVFLQLAEALQRLDVFVEGAEEYADYRRQLLPAAECQKRLPAYCEAAGLPADGKAFVAGLKQQLTELSRAVDAGFPDNAELTLGKDGKPHLKQLKKLPLPDGFTAFERAVQERMPERHLLDILKNVQHWTGFARHFGPPSGSDPKLPDAVRQYVCTVFGYGCNLGASQTASHLAEAINRHTMRRLNFQHITGAKLDAGGEDVIANFIRFALTGYWGDGKTAIADGTPAPLRENNLYGSRHVRYGGFGNIAYNHISNLYIALFCNFIACGVWEGVYILDAFVNAAAVLKPDTLHADTHGQSEPVFALAYLLGIKLLPRMRTWDDVIFYRPDGEIKYEHIDALFTETIDWQLIETHWEDLMQVVISIQAGMVIPSMLLKRLGIKNRKNKLYQAFRELGRVQRTLFLLRYISEADLRRTIRAETTKIESYNDFLDWISFGGPVIKSGDPVEQAKQIKYMKLVANAIMLQNVVDLTNVLNGMIAEGLEVTAAFISHLSPYIRRHILRFGSYILKDDIPEPLCPVPIQIAA
jgi:TnpA family transposase